jgi:tRNA (guanine-N7-)-methyltransferase
MKQKDLAYPFPKEHRTLFEHDNILVIPQWGLEFIDQEFPVWKEVLSRTPALEFCSGNGDWILEKAAEETKVQWVAVEMRYDRIRKIWAKAKNRGIDNLYIVHGKAQDLCRYFLSDDVLSAVYVNFPDPWPKKKHHKNRLFQPEFVDELSRVLVPEGALKIVSDDLPFLLASLENLQACPRFSSELPEPYYTKLDTYGYSYFKELWEEKGREINQLQFVKEGAHVAACSNT